MEVHSELLTQSKMFCRCPVAFGGEPNTRVCPVCLGLPGSLPVPNRKAVELVIKTALALNCQIAMRSVFHRKNYFYPDLPKGYQVSQYGETNPLGYYGHLEIPAGEGTKRIKIRRVHLEEDTGKLLHLPSGGSGVDYNRAGVPLMEIVTDFPPDISTPDEAREYLVQLRQILVYLDICDGKMEEGSLRCEPNISVREAGSEVYGTKTELKNLNSFRSVQLGVAFETRRQIAVIESGGKVLQETRGWNDASESSFAMRIKEAENDYRYFEDPDLIPMEFTEEYVEKLRSELPELPLAKWRRFQAEYGLTVKESDVLVADRDWAGYFEETTNLGTEPKQAWNWMNSDFAKMLNESGQTINPQKADKNHQLCLVQPGHLHDLIQLISAGKISGKMAKDVFAEMFKSGELPSEIVAKSNMSQVSDTSQLEAWVVEVLNENPDVVDKYKSGQQSVVGFLVGQVMKKSQGRANPQIVQSVLKSKVDG